MSQTRCIRCGHYFSTRSATKLCKDCDSVMQHWVEWVEDLVHRKVNYDDYIQSREWRKKAEAAKKRAGYRCQVCNGQDNLEAHHRTYERLGHEHDTDITVLCEKCHKKAHSR